MQNPILCQMWLKIYLLIKILWFCEPDEWSIKCEHKKISKTCLKNTLKKIDWTDTFFYQTVLKVGFNGYFLGVLHHFQHIQIFQRYSTYINLILKKFVNKKDWNLLLTQFRQNILRFSIKPSIFFTTFWLQNSSFENFSFFNSEN